MFTNGVTPLPVGGAAAHGLVVNRAVRDHKKDELDIVSSLTVPKDAQDKLEARVLKGEVIDAEELDDDYSPKQ